MNRHTATRLFSATLLVAAIVDTRPASAADAGQLSRFRFTEPHMGVTFSIVCYAKSKAAATQASQAAFARVEQLNRMLSDYDPNSELSRLSATSGSGRAVNVGDELWLLLKRSQQLSRRTQGAFDITVGPVVKLWRRARRSKKMPGEEQLTKGLESVGFRHLVLDSEQQAVTLRRSRMLLDLGGIAKGYAADEALRVLGEHGVRRALVDASGDLALGAAPPGTRGWKVGIAPLQANAPPSRILYLQNSAVATSGDAWQHVEIDGRRYSHIIDPQTGLGLTTPASVTVVAPDCTTADSLASAVSVMGPERGLKLIESMPSVAALIVLDDHGKPRQFASSRMKELLAAETDQP